MSRMTLSLMGCALAVVASGLAAAPADATPSTGMRITQMLWENSSTIHGVMEGRSFSGPGRIVVSGDAERTYVRFTEEAVAPGSAVTPSMFVNPVEACTPSTGALTASVTCPTHSGHRWIYLDLRDNTQPGREVVLRTVNWETSVDTSEHVPMRVIGGPGMDQVRAFSPGDYVEGGTGPDTLGANAPDITLVGGPGPDTFGADTGARILAADGEEDRVICTTDSVPLISIDEGVDLVWGCDQARYLPSISARPVVSGTPRVDAPLTAARGTWTRGPVTFTFTWFSCATSDGDQCVSRAGPSAVTTTYTPTTADVGRFIMARVTATSDVGTAFADSVPVGPVARGLSNTQRPSISGLTIQGQRITVRRGTWDAGPSATYRYTVRNCKVNSDGTTGSCRVSASGAMPTRTAVYKLVANDVGRSMQVEVTATESGVTRSARSRRTSPVQALDYVTVPASWQPTPNSAGVWKFVRVTDAAFDRWLAAGERELGLSVVYKRVSLAQIKASSAWRKYRDDIPLNNGAIIDVSPDFGDRVTGHILLPTPAVVTVTHYDAMLDLASCPTTGSTALRTMLVNQPLSNAEAKLEALGCAFTVNWSSAAPTDTVHMVDAVSVVTTGSGKAAKRTVVVTARAPRLDGIALAVAPPRASDVAQMPEHATLRLDGTLPAFTTGPVVYSSLALWPVHAGTGLTIEPPSSTAATARVALYDPAGRRVYSAAVGSQIWKNEALLVSAALRRAGTLRVVYTVTDRDRRTIEVYADITVRAATEPFITVDGRCFSAAGAPTDSCPTAPSTAGAVAEYLRSTGLSAQLAGKAPLDALRTASTQHDRRFTALVANGALHIRSAPAGISTLADCQWWDVLCWGGKFVEAVVWLENHSVPAAPEPAIAVPLLEETLLLPTGATAPGITDTAGCIRLTAAAGIGCLDGALNPAKAGMSIRAMVDAGLINLDGGTLASLEAAGLINLDGGTLSDRVNAGLINLDGGTMQRLAKAGLINLDGGTLQVAGPSFTMQPAGRLAFSLSVPMDARLGG